MRIIKMAGLEKEKLSFIKRYGAEIKPISNNPETLRVVDAVTDFENLPADIGPARVNQILEEFETKVFVSEELESRQNSKRVLVEANDPGAYQAIKPLISALEKDERCSGITAMTSGLATLYLQRDFPKTFSQIREKDKPVLVDLLNSVGEKPVDIVLATISSNNAPDSVALFGSKSSLGAKKLFLVLESWGQNLNKTLLENRNNLEMIDGVFCNDGLAKSLFHDKFPDLPIERIYSFGTPMLDSLDVEHAEEHRKKGREKFGVDENTKVLMYCGGISSGAKTWYGSRDDIDEKTFQDTFRQVVQLAEENPDKNFLFALRLHPRDDKKDEKYQFARSVPLPPNLSFRDGGSPLSMNEAAYGSDIILSIVSTENLLAPLRGRKGIFLGFSGKGMGRELLETRYGQSAVPVLANQSEAVRVPDSPEKLKKDLKNLINADLSSKPAVPKTNATEKILDIILAS